MRKRSQKRDGSASRRPARKPLLYVARDRIGDDPESGVCAIFCGRPKKYRCDFHGTCCIHWRVPFEIGLSRLSTPFNVTLPMPYQTLRALFPDIEIEPGQCKRVILVGMIPKSPAKK